VTNPPHGHDGSPSVAALAVRLDQIRADVESLTAKIDTLTTTQQAHAAVIDDVAQLRGQVHQILTVLAAEQARSPAAWFWLTMTDQERHDKHSELLDWVETVLRQQYPDYLANRIRPCWPNHPEARWELAWLYQLWSAVYLANRPMSKDAADWHDRWSPGVIHRLTSVMSQCEGTCVRQPAPAVAGADTDASGCSIKHELGSARFRKSSASSSRPAPW
jgi:hypothetical protein